MRKFKAMQNFHETMRFTADAEPEEKFKALQNFDELQKMRKGMKQKYGYGIRTRGPRSAHLGDRVTQKR